MFSYDKKACCCNINHIKLKYFHLEKLYFSSNTGSNFELTNKQRVASLLEVRKSYWDWIKLTVSPINIHHWFILHWQRMLGGGGCSGCNWRRKHLKSLSYCRITKHSTLELSKWIKLHNSSMFTKDVKLSRIEPTRTKLKQHELFIKKMKSLEAKTLACSVKPHSGQPT